MINVKQVMTSYVYLIFGIAYEELILLLYKKSVLTENTLILRIILFLFFALITAAYIYDFFKHHSKWAHYWDAILNIAGSLSAAAFMYYTYHMPKTIAVHNSVLALFSVSVYCVAFYQLYIYFKSRDISPKVEMNRHVHIGFKNYKMFKIWIYYLFAAFCLLAIVNLFIPIFDMLYMLAAIFDWRRVF